MTVSNQSDIKISFGAVTVEYSGRQDFIENGLVELIKELAALNPAPAPQTAGSQENTGSAYPPLGNHQQLSTNTIVSHMPSQNGPDLIMAAMARIQIIQGQDSVSRKSLLDEMKQATTYYKATYSKNMSGYLSRLIKGKRLNQIAEGKYALPAPERQSLELLIDSA